MGFGVWGLGFRLRAEGSGARSLGCEASEAALVLPVRVSSVLACFAIVPKHNEHRCGPNEFGRKEQPLAAPAGHEIQGYCGNSSPKSRNGNGNTQNHDTVRGLRAWKNLGEACCNKGADHAQATCCGLFLKSLHSILRGGDAVTPSLLLWGLLRL